MILACVLALAPACATTSTGPHYVNVATIKNAISGSIRASGDDRRVTSMGRVRDDAAVAYTTSATGERHEELWVKRGDGWKLETTTVIAERGPIMPPETTHAR
jgi:hypothetical protein